MIFPFHDTLYYQDRWLLFWLDEYTDARISFTIGAGTSSHSIYLLALLIADDATESCQEPRHDSAKAPA